MGGQNSKKPSIRESRELDMSGLNEDELGRVHTSGVEIDSVHGAYPAAV